MSINIQLPIHIQASWERDTNKNNDTFSVHVLHLGFLSSPHVVGRAYCSYSVSVLPSFLPSFLLCQQFIKYRSVQLNVIKMCAPSKIRTRDHRTIRQGSYPLDHGAVHVIYKDHFMVYIQMVMTAEKATKLGHDQVTRLCRC